MNKILKQQFLQFQFLKIEEKKSILCSIVGSINVEVLSTLKLTVEPLSENYVIKEEKEEITEEFNEEEDVDKAAQKFVKEVIEYSVNFLKCEYIKTNSFERFVLNDRRDAPRGRTSLPSVKHIHSLGLKKGLRQIRHSESIFKTMDNATLMIQKLCSRYFSDDERKRFLMEVLYSYGYDLQLHISLCVRKRLEERWNQNNIPENILLLILKNLSPFQLIQTSRVSKSWYRVSRNNSLWQLYYLQYCARIGLSNIVADVVEKIGEDETRINWLEIFRTLSNIFPSIKPRNKTETIEKIDFTKDFTHTKLLTIKEKKRKPKTVRLLPIKNDLEFRSSKMFSRRVSKVFTQLDPDPDNDKRLLMKPILGQLKRFQNSEEFAIDSRSTHLSSLMDHTNQLESKVSLKRKEIDRDSHKTVKLTSQKPVKKMLYIEDCFRLTGHLDGVTFLKCDKVRLASSSLDGTIRLWDSVSGRSMRKMVGHKGGIYCLDFNDKILVSGGWDMSVIVWSLQPNFNVIKVLYGHKDKVTAISIMNDKDLIISASMDGTLRYYNIMSFELEKVVSFTTNSLKYSGIQDMRIECEINVIATAHADRSIRLTKIDDESITMEIGVQLDCIGTIFFQSHLLITGGNTGYLHFWEIETTNFKCISKAQIKIKTDSNLPLSIDAINYYKKSLWTGHDDGTVKEWYVGSMTCLRTIMGHKGPVKCICFLDDIMVTGSLDSSVRMWKISSSINEGQAIDKYGHFRERILVTSVFK